MLDYRENYLFLDKYIANGKINSRDAYIYVYLTDMYKEGYIYYFLIKNISDYFNINYRTTKKALLSLKQARLIEFEKVKGKFLIKILTKSERGTIQKW